jgi:hypothetical protein
VPRTHVGEGRPLTLPLVSGNLLLEQHQRDAWSVYRLGRLGCDGPRLPDGGPGALAIAELCDLLDVEFTLLRVARPWSVDHYAIGFEAVADIRHAQRDALTAYVRAQRGALEALGSYTADTILSVRLPTPPRGLSASGMIAWRGRAEAMVFDRIRQEVAARRAERSDLRRLVHHALRRGLLEAGTGVPAGEDSPAGAGPRASGPEPVVALSKSVVRFDQQGRMLRIQSELGTSHQSLLRLEGLGRTGAEAGYGIDLVLGRLEAVEFPVDVALRVRRVSEQRVLGVLEGDVPVVRARPGESPTARPVATVSLAVGAAGAAELERRVVRLRRELTGIRLHRSAGEQMSLFDDHLPGRPDCRTSDRAGIPVKHLGVISLRRSIVGSHTGPYLGFTAAGAPRPVLFDPFEAGGGRPTLITGAAGSGKTLCLELIMYQAFIAGAAVIDLDLRGDHALERLPGVARRAAVLEFSAAGRFRGLLDPLRIAPNESRERLATDFLAGILPTPVPVPWQLEIAHAVRTVVHRNGRGCADVVDELTRGGAPARAAARAIRAAAAGTPAALAFGSADAAPPEPEVDQVTTLRLRDLAPALPGKGGAGSVPTRVGSAIARLVTAYALRLAQVHRHRQCVLCLDDASLLVVDDAGRTLLDRLTSGTGRADFTPLIALPTVEDISWLARRFGRALCFRVANARQTHKVQQLLRPARSQTHLVRDLVDARAGRCVMRDQSGRVDAVQVEFVDDRLLATLDTTPAGDPRWRG